MARSEIASCEAELTIGQDVDSWWTDVHWCIDEYETHAGPHHCACGLEWTEEPPC